MLYRVVRPMFRKNSRMGQVNRRIPIDVRPLVAGLKLRIPLGDEFALVTLSPKTAAVKLSLRTADPAEIKIRNAVVAAHLERIWQHLRESKPIVLTNRQATALAGRLYRAWVGGEGAEIAASITLDRETRQPVLTADTASADNVPEYWGASRLALEKLKVADEEYADKVSRGFLDPSKHRRPFEAAFGAIVDELLAREGIMQIEPESRALVLEAFRVALMDAFAARERNAGGDYSPDPKSERFPELLLSAPPPPPPTPSPATRKPKASLSGILEAWWAEAKAGATSVSTYDSYERTFRKLREFLGHDDASKVTADDLRRFKVSISAEI